MPLSLFFLPLLISQLLRRFLIALGVLKLWYLSLLLLQLLLERLRVRKTRLEIRVFGLRGGEEHLLRRRRLVIVLLKARIKTEERLLIRHERVLRLIAVLRKLHRLEARRCLVSQLLEVWSFVLLANIASVERLAIMLHC